MGIDGAAFRARYGPWAVVAGAAEGLGAAWARALAGRGLPLVLVDRQADALAATAAAITTTAAVPVRRVVADLGRADGLGAVERALTDVAVGFFVYNAAASPIGSFLDAPVERAVAAIDVNCRGMATLVHAAATAMATRGRGGIVLMSSLSADQGSPRLAAYAATKAFTLVFGESLWAELRDRGIDVLTVRPGSVRTPGWEASQPDESDPGALPPMEPDAVVAEALAVLGEEPSVVAGEANRRAEALLRALPRRQAIDVMAAVTARLRTTTPR